MWEGGRKGGEKGGRYRAQEGRRGKVGSVDKTSSWLPHLHSLPDKVLCLPGRTKSPPSLLVHLGSGGHSIYCHKNHLLWLNHPEQRLEGRKNTEEQICYRHPPRIANRSTIASMANREGLEKSVGDKARKESIKDVVIRHWRSKKGACGAGKGPHTLSSLLPSLLNPPSPTQSPPPLPPGS